MEQIETITPIHQTTEIFNLLSNHEVYLKGMVKDISNVYDQNSLSENLGRVERELTRMGKVKAILAKRQEWVRKTEEFSVLLIALESAESNTSAGRFIGSLKKPIGEHECTFFEKCVAAGLFAAELKPKIEAERQRVALKIEEQQKLKKCIQLLMEHYQDYTNSEINTD